MPKTVSQLPKIVSHLLKTVSQLLKIVSQAGEVAARPTEANEVAHGSGANAGKCGYLIIRKKFIAIPGELLHPR